MIRITLLLCCFLLISQDQAVISWHESYKLSWSDFKQSLSTQSNAVAVTASGLTFGFSTKKEDSQVISFTTHVHAYFYPEDSWYKPELANKYILEHEQLHFDITELHARKFRKSIVQLKVSNQIATQLKSLHKNINNDAERMQNNYDTETDFSRNKEQQAKWKVFVTSELKKFSVYKSN